jgi:hypothetical protein
MKSRRFWGVLAAVILTLMMLFASASPVMAASAGPRNAGTAATVDHADNTDWTGSPTLIAAIAADDANFASVDLHNGSTSDYLEATNYGFTIPTGATINGIQVTIMRYSSSNSGGSSIDDAHVRIIKGGSITGNDKQQSGTTNWPTSEVLATYGNSSDLWGATPWTAADINATNFGVALAVTNENNGNHRIAYVDYIQVTVTYTIKTDTTTPVLTLPHMETR